MKNKDAKKYWRNDYWDELQKADFDSESKLEQYVFTISTGAVGILLGTTWLQVRNPYLCYEIASLCSFSMSMLLCVIYHIIAISSHRKQFEKIKEFVSGSQNQDSDLRKDIEKGNTVLYVLSICYVFFIFAGVVLFVVYIILLNGYEK